jgi:hypothetical protein
MILPSVVDSAQQTPCDLEIKLMARVGLVLSVLMAAGATNAFLCLSIWALYMSITNLGSVFYGFGWEMQMLETMFFAAFLCPWRSVRPFPPRGPPSRAAVAALLWVEARVMLGAGLIKLRGDPCWRDLSCMQFFYETQPVPSPLSWLWHQLPAPVLWGGVVVNHVVELAVPPLVFGPRRVRRAAGLVLILFQCLLILSGNLSWLNWLTLAPCFLCLDDAVWPAVLPLRSRPGRVWAPPPASVAIASRVRAGGVFDVPPRRARPGAARGPDKSDVPAVLRPPSPSAARTARSSTSAGTPVATASLGAGVLRAVVRLQHALLLAAVVYLSIPVVANLLSPQQAMNRSYNALQLVNTYGAFGSVQRDRLEVVLEGTMDPAGGGGWHEYEFRCKPGNVRWLLLAAVACVRA